VHREQFGTVPDVRGPSVEQVLAELEALRGADVDWRSGRAFTLAYHAGDDVDGLAKAAYAAYATENALNTDAFPSLRRMQAEVVATVVGWVQGGSAAAGVFTSGGTESLLMAVLAARERGRERGIEDPEMVLATSAHAAFDKAAHYFGVRAVRVPVGPDWRADVTAMAAAVTDRTVLVVGSAPQYPQGVVDPVPELAAIAAERDLNCHVDACIGGVVLPFLERLGRAVPPWDFRVPGVTSISVDLHKYGYGAKGASVLVHADAARRRHQYFVTDRWLGGRYGSPGMMGSKSGGPIAAAWAVLRYLGDDGYLRLAAQARRATERIAAGVAAIDGLALRAAPDTTLFAFGPSPSSASPAIDVDALVAALWRRGWYLDRQGPPPSLHCTVNAVHEAVAGEFLADLASCVDEVRLGARAGDDGPRAYGTLE
jgi:sphinganine-1-phosphate aldolase